MCTLTGKVFCVISVSEVVYYGQLDSLYICHGLKCGQECCCDELQMTQQATKTHTLLLYNVPLCCAVCLSVE